MCSPREQALSKTTTHVSTGHTSRNNAPEDKQPRICHCFSHMINHLSRAETQSAQASKRPKRNTGLAVMRDQGVTMRAVLAMHTKKKQTEFCPNFIWLPPFIGNLSLLPHIFKFLSFFCENREKDVSKSSKNAPTELRAQMTGVANHLGRGRRGPVRAKAAPPMLQQRQCIESSFCSSAASVKVPLPNAVKETARWNMSSWLTPIR